MCNTWRQRCLLPWTTDFHPGIRSTELTKLIETFSILCCFLLPNTLQISQHWGMNKLFNLGSYLAARFNLLTTNTFYSKCACSSESLGDITKWISHLSSMQNNTLKSPNFTLGQISLLNSVINLQKCFVPKTFTEIQNPKGDFQGSSLPVYCNSISATISKALYMYPFLIL